MQAKGLQTTTYQVVPSKSPQARREVARSAARLSFPLSFCELPSKRNHFCSAEPLFVSKDICFFTKYFNPTTFGRVINQSLIVFDLVLFWLFLLLAVSLGLFSFTRRDVRA